MKSSKPAFISAFAMATALSAFNAANAAQIDGGKIDFQRDIQPILSRHCHECHSGSKVKGGLRLDQRQAALQGGDSGPAVVPANPAASLLFKAVSGLDPDLSMPPKGEKLSAQEVQLIKSWIETGADWPELKIAGTGPAPELAHWSFKPIQRPALPSVKNNAWPRKPVDFFVLSRLEKEGVPPSPEADRAALARRLSLDLLGLPPSPEVVDSFVKDQRADAYERLVDSLLASPHFGEHWGRHWLDLARYADSDGYEKDGVRPFAYVYRDWVIDAFNRDLPFDQFTLDQLAGDLLPGATQEQRIATGFHRNTLTNKEGGVDKEEWRTKAVKDRVSTTGTVWLGLTIACAECHTHKYDPITQREFYQLYAFFNNADEVDLPLPRPDELVAFEAEKKRWNAEKAKLEKDLEQLSKAEPAVEPALKKLKEQLDQHSKKAPALNATKAMILAELDKNRRATRIHVRGDFLRKGDEVAPGSLSILPPLQPRAETPDRIDLAHWLTDPANPLTSRVTVNRIWGHLFGRALAPTMDDFGTRGEPPSHPELLDWLASELIARGWSQKEMIKLLVMSATYRQSSRHREDLSERDPNNVLLARQNRFRLPAENVRDVFLASGGLLNPVIGGPSIRPPLPADIAALGYANSVKWQESKGADQYRRGMYILFQRTVPYPMLMTFDAPDSNATCTMRERSNTPLQALTLLNDPVFFECARNLGLRMAGHGGANVEQAIRHGFRLCLSREPTAVELDRLRLLYEGQLRLLQGGSGSAEKIMAAYGNAADATPESAALVNVARIMMNLDEFITRE